MFDYLLSVVVVVVVVVLVVEVAKGGTLLHVHTLR